MLSIRQLKKENDLKELAENYIEQNHFGDFLILEIDKAKDDRYRLWNNHKENQRQGEPKYQLEHFDGNKWKTIDTQNS